MMQLMQVGPDHAVIPSSNAALRPSNRQTCELHVNIDSIVIVLVSRQSPSPFPADVLRRSA